MEATCGILYKRLLPRVFCATIDSIRSLITGSFEHVCITNDAPLISPDLKVTWPTPASISVHRLGHYIDSVSVTAVH